jgi:hypothetical protein
VLAAADDDDVPGRLCARIELAREDAIALGPREQASALHLREGEARALLGRPGDRRAAALLIALGVEAGRHDPLVFLEPRQRVASFVGRDRREARLLRRLGEPDRARRLALGRRSEQEDRELISLGAHVGRDDQRPVGRVG